MLKLATLTFLVEDDELVVLDEEGFQVGHTTLADAVLRSERLWHFLYDQARQASE